MTSVRPFLMFQGGKAEEAMKTYVALIPDSEILSLERYSAEGPGTEGQVYRAIFRLAGQEVRCFDSPIRHSFEFTPSFSFFVDCKSNEEIERYVAVLGEGGKALMPLDHYGFSRRFAWVSDRFGVSWQFNLP